MPVDLFRAIQQADRILDWQANLTDEEMPPVWMWCIEDELAPWFERVHRERDEKYNRKSADTPPEGGYMENELARGRR